MKYFLIVLTLVLCGINTKAQLVTTMRETAEDSVKAVINKLFTGMKTADASLLKTCFADSMIL